MTSQSVFSKSFNNMFNHKWKLGISKLRIEVVFHPDPNTKFQTPINDHPPQTPNSTPLPAFRRTRKRKLFHDDDPTILDLKSLLKKYDIENRTPYGRRIIETAESRQPLSISLRRKLISISCHSLMNKTNSDRPSTDQRHQLAECIVDQLFSYMGESEKLNLKQSYYTPSSTYKNEVGKVISKRPMGYIQSFFVNFWHANKEVRKGPPNGNKRNDSDEDIESLNPEELRKLEDWLSMNKGPVQKVFEILNQTYGARKKFLKQCKDFSEITRTWPRLLDIDGAIQNDFSIAYPLAADNLFFNWKTLAPKIMKYAEAIKRSTETLGIPLSVAEGNVEFAALFMVPFLVRPKNKRISQVNSAESFIKVVPNGPLDPFLQDKSDIYPQILLLGSKLDFDFQEFCVLFSGKAVKCSNLLEAVDVAFKAFYVFNIEFTPNCNGAWQFLDYAVYKMKVVTPVISGVTELAAYVCQDSV